MHGDKFTLTKAGLAWVMRVGSPLKDDRTPGRQHFTYMGIAHRGECEALLPHTIQVDKNYIHRSLHSICEVILSVSCLQGINRNFACPGYFVTQDLWPTEQIYQNDRLSQK